MSLHVLDRTLTVGTVGHDMLNNVLDNHSIIFRRNGELVILSTNDLETVTKDSVFYQSCMVDDLWPTHYHRLSDDKYLVIYITTKNNWLIQEAILTN